MSFLAGAHVSQRLGIAGLGVLDVALFLYDTQALERQLSQMENELRQKDNDTYRRQHTVFS